MEAKMQREKARIKTEFKYQNRKLHKNYQSLAVSHNLENGLNF